MFLDEIEQPLFGFEVVIEPSEGHPALTREVAHRGAFVSLSADDFGGVVKNLCQPPVIAGFRSRRRSAVMACGDSSCCGRTPHNPLSRSFERSFEESILPCDSNHNPSLTTL